MKVRLFLAAAFVALLAAIGPWYLKRPTAPEAAPAPAALSPGIKVAAPVMASTPPAGRAAKTPPHYAAVAATSLQLARHAAENPNAADEYELNAAINEMKSLLQMGDFATLLERYTPPNSLAKLPPELTAQVKDALQNPQMQQEMQMLAKAMQSLQGQTPEFNAAGDRATYQISLPPELLPPGVTAAPKVPITFVKIAGHWYAGGDSGLGL